MTEQKRNEDWALELFHRLYDLDPSLPERLLEALKKAKATTPVEADWAKRAMIICAELLHTHLASDDVGA